MKNTILVLGATGNIGRLLIQTLRDKNTDIIAAVNQHPIEGVKTVSVDYSDTASLARAMQGVDTLFMLLPAHPDMVVWGKNIIAAAKQSSIKHIVRSSSQIAYSAETFDFMKSVRETDEDVVKSGIDYTITLPQFFMQNLSTMMAADYRDGALYLPAGDGEIGWVDVRDIAAVTAEILINPSAYKNQRIVISGSETLSYHEVVARMNEVLDKKSTYIPISDEAAIEAMETNGFPTFFINVLMDLNRAVAQHRAATLSDSIKRITGKEPIAFREFVKDHRACWV